MNRGSIATNRGSITADLDESLGITADHGGSRRELADLAVTVRDCSPAPDLFLKIEHVRVHVFRNQVHIRHVRVHVLGIMYRSDMYGYLLYMYDVSKST